MTEATRQQMQALVDGCMGESAPYCQAACPMHTDVRSYVNLIAEGRYHDALSVIREKLFLPATLGRICAHPCEDSCKRGELGHPMAIASLKRFVADKYDNPNQWNTEVPAEQDESVAIIGAGPAGAQAAVDLRRKGYRVTIFDRLNVVGGMMRVGIPAYRLPRDVIDLEYSLLEGLGVEFRMNTNIGTDVTLEELESQYDAVIVAVGAHTGVVPPVPGKDSEGVYDAVEVLRDVSLKGTFEGLGERVLVVGGGNVAMDAARSTRRLNLRNVQIACLECSVDCMPAHSWEVQEAVEEGITMHTGWGIDTINATDGKVTSVTLKRCTQVFDENGAFSPCFDDTEKQTIEVDSVIFAIGQKVDGGGLESLPRTNRGQLACDPTTLRVEERNIFVAGDASGHSVIAVAAMAEGRKAARSVYRMFTGQDLSAEREKERAYQTDLETEIPENVENTPRVQTRQRDPKERIRDFNEVDLGLEEAQAIAEGGRCLSCECRKCVKECLMLQEYASTCPKHLFEKYLNGEKVDPIVAYSCNMCNLCTIVCPKSFKIAEPLMAMRKEYVKQNKGKSPMKGHNAIYMHQKLGFGKIFTVRQPAPNGKANTNGRTNTHAEAGATNSDASSNGEAGTGNATKQKETIS